VGHQSNAKFTSLNRERGSWVKKFLNARHNCHIETEKERSKAVCSYPIVPRYRGRRQRSPYPGNGGRNSDDLRAIRQHTEAPPESATRASEVSTKGEAHMRKHSPSGKRYGAPDHFVVSSEGRRKKRIKKTEEGSRHKKQYARTMPRGKTNVPEKRMAERSPLIRLDEPRNSD